MKIFAIDDNKINCTFIEQDKTINDVQFSAINNKVYYHKPDTTISKVKLNEWVIIKENYYLVIEDKYYHYHHDGKILISRIGDIKLDVNILIDNNHLYIKQCKFICINNQPVIGNDIILNDGDLIVIDHVVFTYHEDVIIVWGNQLQDTNLEMIREISYQNPIYEKSPRVYYGFNENTIEILNPPGKEKISKNTIAKIIIPPLISILTTGLMAYFMRRGIFLIIAVITTICSLTFSISSFVKEHKQIKEENKNRKQKYNQYLLKQRKELHDLYNHELEVYDYKLPSSNEIASMIQNSSPRIYERSTGDSDFLHVSMGYTSLEPHYKIKFNDNALILDEDELHAQAKEIYQQYLKIKDVKYSIDLKQNHVGIIGSYHLVHEEVKRLIMEICCFHSYHDVNIILLYSQAYKNEFMFTDWLRHVSINNGSITGNIYNDRIKEQSLSILYQIIKQRSLEVNSKREHAFFPHYVIYIDDISLIANHPIMEFLQGNEDLGISLILRVDEFSDLPSNFNTVFDVKDNFNIDLLLLNGDKKDERLVRDNAGDIDYEYISRYLSIFDHQLGVSNSIPDMVTFLDMYQVDTPDKLDIINRWNQSKVFETMAVPLGLRGDKDIVYLDLHEKYHGPHGLIAGTTGSGKSEIVQSYILSLAVNFSPHDVGFLLIDFKGGGMANLFKDLPHLIGTITNLDGAESMRALASIKSELKRRQHIFNENDVNNINMYSKLCKENPELEPLPHLFIISDEFAELKKEQPDFMDELVSVARIGRTLGVHLILATQKPTGVVNDQIWSNSKFKLALKVQDESDSKEILKTPDAAYITKTGRAYLQVGNNEVYELFQSAWSGASYDCDVDEIDEEFDKRVYLINELGQRLLLNDEQYSSEDKSKIRTQLDAVVDKINQVYHEAEYTPVKKAWLPSLPNKITNPNIDNYNVIDLAKIEDVCLNFDLGIVDIPDKQTQKVYNVDFSKKPNLAIYGSGGYGKSFALSNVILDLAIKNNPELLEFYIIDLGNSGLVGLSPLVHVADYISLNTIDKINKLINRINKIVEQRKTLLTINAAQNIGVLEDSLKEKHQRIVVVIDNFDVAKELGDDFINFVDKLSQEGPSLGIYLMISASRAVAIKASTTNNMNNKLCLYMQDNNDISSIVGKSKYPLSDTIKGRCLVRDDGVNQMQMFVCFENKPLSEYNNKMKEFISKINDKFTGRKPKAIPQLPDEFNSMMLSEYDYQDDDVTTNIVGVSVSDVMQVGINPYPPILIVCGHLQSGKSNMLKLLISQADSKVYAIDSKNKGLLRIKDLENAMYCDCEEDVNMMVKNINKLIEQRKKQCFDLLTKGEIDSTTQYYSGLEEKVVFIDDINDFTQNYGKITSFSTLINEATECGIKFVIGLDATASICPLDSDVARIIKTVTNQIIVGKMSTYNPMALGNKVFPKLGFGVVAIEGDMRRIKIPLYISKK